MPDPGSLPLNLLPDVQLSAEQINRIGAIEAYDMWFVIERLTKSGALPPDRIEHAITEFKKYMALVAIGYQSLGMHSNEIDEVWHAFILFTREYSDFCEHTCGQMVHHRPNTSRRPELPAPSVPTFVEAYKKFFGSIPEIWQTPNSNQAQTQNSDCDSAGMNPDVKITPGDCDVVQAPPPCKSVLQADCDSNGLDTCKAEFLGGMTPAQFALDRR